MSKFAMSDSEIVSNWKHSKQNRGQVRVLSELCGVSEVDMEDKLAQLGCPYMPAPAQPKVIREALTAKELLEVLAALVDDHPDAPIHIGGKISVPVTGVELLTRYARSGSECLYLRIV